jgi:hypothetical protein
VNAAAEPSWRVLIADDHAVTAVTRPMSRKAMQKGQLTRTSSQIISHTAPKGPLLPGEVPDGA